MAKAVALRDRWMSESTDVTNQTRAAINSYFEGFNARDISRMPIATNVHFKAPVNASHWIRGSPALPGASVLDVREDCCPPGRRRRGVRIRYA